jgi:hypothetical protein
MMIRTVSDVPRYSGAALHGTERHLPSFPCVEVFVLWASTVKFHELLSIDKLQTTFFQVILTEHEESQSQNTEINAERTYTNDVGAVTGIRRHIIEVLATFPHVLHSQLEALERETEDTLT